LKADLIEHAAETFGDRPWLNGRGEFGIVAYSPTWQEQVQTLKATVADLRATAKAGDRTVSQLTMQTKTLAAANAKVGSDLAAAKARIAELEGTPSGCVDQVNAERARVLDALSGAIDEAIASLR
jgi:chromosome segregation ATPase